MTEDACRVYEVDGEPVNVRGSGPLSVDGEAALAEVVRAAKAMLDADPNLAARQSAALERFRGRWRK